MCICMWSFSLTKNKMAVAHLWFNGSMVELARGSRPATLTRRPLGRRTWARWPASAPMPSSSLRILSSQWWGGSWYGTSLLLSHQCQVCLMQQRWLGNPTFWKHAIAISCLNINMYPLTEFSSGLTAADNRVSLRGQPSLCKYFIKIWFLSVKRI